MAKKRNYERATPSHYLLLHDIKTRQQFYCISCQGEDYAKAMKGALYRLFHYKLKKDWFTFEVITKDALDARNSPNNLPQESTPAVTPKEKITPKEAFPKVSKEVSEGMDLEARIMSAMAKVLIPAIDKAVSAKMDELTPKKKARG
jgi:hypothetical protein